MFFICLWKKNKVGRLSGDGSVGKVSAMPARGPELNLRTHVKKCQAWYHKLVVLVLRDRDRYSSRYCWPISLTESGNPRAQQQAPSLKKIPGVDYLRITLNVDL